MTLCGISLGVSAAAHPISLSEQVSGFGRCSKAGRAGVEVDVALLRNRKGTSKENSDEAARDCKNRMMLNR